MIFDSRIPGWQSRIRLRQTKHSANSRPGFGRTMRAGGDTGKKGRLPSSLGIQSGETPPCRMTGVTLHNHVRYSGHPTRGCIPTETEPRTSVVSSEVPLAHSTDLVDALENPLEECPQAEPPPLLQLLVSAEISCDN